MQTRSSPRVSDVVELLLVVDTGVLLAAADSSDPDHAVCASLLAIEPGPLLASPLVVAEAAYLIGRQLGPFAESAFMRSIAAGEITMETLTGAELLAVSDLIDRYADLGLGAADASVVVLAGRHGSRRIATLDRRHFTVVRTMTGESFELVP